MINPVFVGHALLVRDAGDMPEAPGILSEFLGDSVAVNPNFLSDSRRANNTMMAPGPPVSLLQRNHNPAQSGADPPQPVGDKVVRDEEELVRLNDFSIIIIQIIDDDFGSIAR